MTVPSSGPRPRIAGVTDSHVVVTGAAGGIGRAVVAAFTDAGAHVHAADLHGSDDGRVRAVDVTDPVAVADFFGGLTRVDAVVHCAGIIRVGRVTDLTDDDWAALMRVNAGGTMVVCRAAARVVSGPASITEVSSNAGATPRAQLAAYGASKAAATSFVRSLGLEVAEHGIRCNVISPGSTETPMLQASWAGEDRHAAVLGGDPGLFRLGIPLRRVADPADVASAALFLVSDAARHITMHDLRVDGGATLDI